MNALWTDGERRALRWLTLLGLTVIAARWGLQQRPGTPSAMPAEEQARLEACLAQARQLDLNGADVAALEALPGIGRVTAERIVAHRQAHGPFAGVDALRRVPGVAPGLVGRVRAFVTVHARGGD